MLSTLLASAATDAASFAAAAPSPEAERIGVYILSGIVGLLVAGLIACAKDIRADLLDRR